jgi:predicted transposase YbfD/YdcC
MATEFLELKGCIVTADAMACQKQIAAKITGGAADYVLALKGNQGKLHEQVGIYLDELIAGCERDTRAWADRGQAVLGR